MNIYAQSDVPPDVPAEESYKQLERVPFVAQTPPMVVLRQISTSEFNAFPSRTWADRIERWPISVRSRTRLFRAAGLLSWWRRLLFEPSTLHKVAHVEVLQGDRIVQFLPGEEKVLICSPGFDCIFVDLDAESTGDLLVSNVVSAGSPNLLPFDGGVEVSALSRAWRKSLLRAHIVISGNMYIHASVKNIGKDVASIAMFAIMERIGMPSSGVEARPVATDG
jgi:hypothetical protein